MTPRLLLPRLALTSLGALAVGCLTKKGEPGVVRQEESLGASSYQAQSAPDGRTCDCRDLSGPQVSSRQVMVKEAERVVVYIIINEPISPGSPGHRWSDRLATLVRVEHEEVLADGKKKIKRRETKILPVSDCFGRAERIATDGKNIYLVYEQPLLREDPRFVYVGKVVVEGGERRIGFFRREIPPDLKQADTVRFAQHPETGQLNLAVGWNGKFSEFFSPLVGDEVVNPVRSSCGGG